MKGLFARYFVVLGVTWVGAAPPGQSSPALKPSTAAGRQTARPVPFAAGETLMYDVSWSSYLTAGTATLKVMEKKPSYGSDAYYIVAEGRPTPLLSKLYDLYYKADTLLDVYALLPQRASIYSREGKRDRMKVTMFDRAARKAHYEVQTRTVEKKDFAIPADTQDALSSIYVFELRLTSMSVLLARTGDRSSSGTRTEAGQPGPNLRRLPGLLKRAAQPLQPL